MSNIIEAINKGKEAYHKLDTVSESKAALARVRDNIRHIFPAVKLKKARLEEEIKDILETYTAKAASPKIEEKRNAFKRDAETIQAKLRDQLASVLQAKREAAQRYIMTLPSADQLTLLNTLKLRGPETIDDSEWQMYISTLAGNYQCAQILATIAKEGGKEFIPPVTSVHDLEEELTIIESWLNEAIDNLARPDDLSYRTLEILTDRDNTPSGELISKLDREIISTVPSSSLSLRNRLKDAAQHALHMGDYGTFHEIYDFIGGNDESLSTPQEKAQSLLEEAEALIEKGMNAKEVRTQYEQHRDEVIRHLERAHTNVRLT